MLIQNMKTKFVLTALSLILSIGLVGCSDNDYDPEDYVTSLLSGEYEKDGMWKLYVTVNGTPLEKYGHVRFDSKYLKEADLRFVDIIPGESLKEYNKIPLTEVEDGYSFKIDDSLNGTPIIVSGIVTFGKMTVVIIM